MATETEEVLKRIQSHRGVKAVLIVNSDGVPIRSNLSTDLAENYAALITQLATKAASVVRTMDANDDLTFLRVRSKQHEILVAPDKEYLLVVLQQPNLD